MYDKISYQRIHHQISKYFRVAYNVNAFGHKPDEIVRKFIISEGINLNDSIPTKESIVEYSITVKNDIIGPNERYKSRETREDMKFPFIDLKDFDPENRPESITITKDHIEAGFSPRGGLRHTQFQYLMLSKEKGWKDMIIGTKLSKVMYDAFLSNRNDAVYRTDGWTWKDYLAEFKKNRKEAIARNMERFGVPYERKGGKCDNYLHSEEWANIRLDLFANRGEKCEICENEKMLQVHHLTYERIFNEDPADLIIVCAGCHYKLHGK